MIAQVHKPYMTDEEAEIIRGHLQQHRPRRCLEWGIGNSTLAFSTEAGIKEWIGIDHNDEWVKKVAAACPDHVRVYLAENQNSALPLDEKFAAYVDHKSIHGEFDFIFIDGQHRWQCLKKAAELLAPGGYCFVHDSARKDMHPHFDAFRHHTILTEGEVNTNGDPHQGLTMLWNHNDHCDPVPSQNKRMLVLCFPTWGKRNDLHTNSTGQWTVLAPDEMIRLLRDRGCHVDVASIMDEPVHLPLMRSKLCPMQLDEVDFSQYDVVWHMFRDPTQPEVYARLRDLDMNCPGQRVINDVSRFKELTKWTYLPVLSELQIGPKIIHDLPEKYGRSEAWNAASHSAQVSKDRKYIRLYAVNNNRGDYEERRGREKLTVEYVDNLQSGVRSFFRIGYSLGRVCDGWLYCHDESATVLKSGMSKHQIPFSMPSEYHAPIIAAMNRLGVDVAHIEGLFKKDKLYIFDINPYPTAHGGTLTRVTAGIVDVIEEKLFG